MKRIRVLVIGLGSIGRRHVGILSDSIPCDVFVFRQHHIAPEQIPGVSRFLFHWSEVEKVRPDFAVICNPTVRHVPTAIALAERGIPFLMEKPVCASRRGVAALCRLVENRRLPVLVGFNLRHHYLYKKIRGIAASGRYGRLLSFFSETGQYLPDWRASDYRQTTSALKALGGGVIFDLTHEIDLALDLMGKARSVSCLKGRFSGLEIETEDVAEITLAHGGGVSHIHLDYLQKAYTRRFKLLFEGADLFWDYAAGSLVLTSGTGRREFRQPAGYGRDDTFRAQLKHWLRVWKGQEPPVVSLDTGLRVSDVAIAAHRSSDKRKWIDLP